MIPIHLLIVISGVWGLSFSPANQSQIVCPKYCNCDLYENLNRADCSDKKLISTSIDIPPTVEILDLSYNDISSLEDKCFKDLKYLINLTISNNGIHTIFLDAFYDLVNLQHIDLSFNRLEYFDPRIFENNKKLMTVNLDNNKFMSLSNEPFIISTSLQYLTLHKSQIVQISELQFVKMPLLAHLDLSDNFMVTLNVGTFMTMSHLKTLNILNNRWTTCHTDLKNTVEYLRGRNVEVRTNVCNTKFGDGEKKFERMMMAPATEPPVEKDVSAIWKNSSELNRTDIFQCDTADVETVCNLYESCTLKYNKLIADQLINQYRLKFIDHNERVYVALYSGIFLGFFVTSSISYVIYLICGSRYWRKRRLQRKLAERRRQPSAYNHPTYTPTTRACRPIHRPVHRPPAHQSHPTRHAANRANQRDFFLARIFERPERHRYNHNNLPTNSRLTSGTPQNLDTERLIRRSPADDSETSPIAVAVEENEPNQLQVEEQNHVEQQHHIDQQHHVEQQHHVDQHHNEQTNDEQPLENDSSNSETIIVMTPTIEDPPPSIETLRAETPPPPYSEIVRD